MKIITHKTYNQELYSLRHPFAAFYLQLQPFLVAYGFDHAALPDKTRKQFQLVTFRPAHQRNKFLVKPIIRSYILCGILLPPFIFIFSRVVRYTPSSSTKEGLWEYGLDKQRCSCGGKPKNDEPPPENNFHDLLIRVKITRKSCLQEYQNKFYDLLTYQLL
mgnify:CR=1 FL=1